ncbi:MAG TPA: TlpA disulfide reductase family protein [Steroidobacteraceae bacterium]|nr:TlpA disulfide reductase family protein [Steroidobacteraceae bacterium]
MNNLLKTAGLAVLSFGGAVALAGDKLDGRWDAQLVRDQTVIPFRLDISGSGKSLRGTLYDGFRAYEYTTGASYDDGKLVLNIEHYLTTISAQLQDGKLVGDVVAQNRGSRAEYGFVATRHDASKDGASDAAFKAANAPSIGGDWEIPLSSPSSKGEKAFRLIVDQRGAEVAASILRVDGDTGAYSGTFQDGQWVLSHFDGSRPGVIVVKPAADGTLEIVQNVQRPRTESAGEYGSNAPDGRYDTKLVAYRPDVARAKGLPEPANHLAHTTARDPNEKFAFAFKDIDGKLVTNDDVDHKGQVVLAIVTGTWCPNCHDEAQYLIQLDRKYRDKGLRIVALNFEEVEQQDSLQRVKAFVKQYGVKYPYLQAGAPEEMWEKVPQLVNLNTWPATVFVGRDGTVRAVHAGFASPSTGDFYAKQQEEFTSRIEKLLAEKKPADVRVTSNTAPVKFGP